MALSQRLPPCTLPVSALAAAMDRICTPPSSPVSLTSPSPLTMRTPWQQAFLQAFYEEYGVEYESEFKRGGGPYNPCCSHPWERSSSTCPSSSEWVFNSHDHTTPPPSPWCSSPPESPPRSRRRVTDIDRCDASPQLMARGPRTCRGNSITADHNSRLYEFRHCTYCATPAQPKAPLKCAVPKPRLSSCDLRLVT